MDIRITPSTLSGSVKAIPSKSQAQRALICAAVADRPSDIYLSLIHIWCEMWCMTNPAFFWSRRSASSARIKEGTWACVKRGEMRNNKLG